ncbi:hypothetical protein [Alienimonas sp. DA493]|uniref:hypothetical protein n=1 Tax=Alienimonas sp. DA493 TaxID=3373605 RepID=UPI0037545370
MAEKSLAEMLARDAWKDEPHAGEDVDFRKDGKEFRTPAPSPEQVAARQAVIRAEKLRQQRERVVCATEERHGSPRTGRLLVDR